MKIDYFLLKELESYVFSVLNENNDEVFKFEEFQIKIKKHQTGEAYICVIACGRVNMNFIVDATLIDESMIKESLFADIICRHLKNILENLEKK